MMDQMRLPVGTRFEAVVNNERITVEVCEGGSCVDCAFEDSNRLCMIMNCGIGFGDDKKERVIKKVEGGEE